MTAEPNITDSADPRTYSDTWSVDDKLDFIAYHLRMQSGILDEMRTNQDEQFSDLLARINAIGQKTTNIDAFCSEARSAVEGMRKNPLMRGMMPPLPPGPGKLIT